MLHVVSQSNNQKIGAEDISLETNRCTGRWKNEV